MSRSMPSSSAMIAVDLRHVARTGRAAPGRRTASRRCRAGGTAGRPPGTAPRGRTGRAPGSPRATYSTRSSGAPNGSTPHAVHPRPLRAIRPLTDGGVPACVPPDGPVTGHRADRAVRHRGSQRHDRDADARRTPPMRRQSRRPRPGSAPATTYGGPSGGGMVHPGNPPRHRGQHLPGDRGAPSRQFHARRSARPPGRPEAPRPRPVRRSGISVTSTISASIAIDPTIGARRPQTSTSAPGPGAARVPIAVADGQGHDARRPRPRPSARRRRRPCRRAPRAAGWGARGWTSRVAARPQRPRAVGRHGQVVRDDAIERQARAHQLQRRARSRRAARRSPPGGGCGTAMPARPHRAPRRARARRPGRADTSASSGDREVRPERPPRSTPGTAASAAATGPHRSGGTPIRVSPVSDLQVDRRRGRAAPGAGSRRSRSDQLAGALLRRRRGWSRPASTSSSTAATGGG